MQKQTQIKKSIDQLKPVYIKKGIIRFVEDYSYLFQTYVKQRWQNQKLNDFFCNEFKMDDKEYYKNAIETGKILVNNQISSLDYLLKQNDLISHTTIRYEPPVYNLPLEVIFENKDIIAINKPSSIPVHPCGQFHFNSVISIFKFEQNLEVFPIHRLDKNTSGVLILSKNPKHNISFQNKDENGYAKEYLARVNGKFLQ